MLSLWHDTVRRGDKHNRREAGKKMPGVCRVSGLSAQGAMQTSAGASPRSTDSKVTVPEAEEAGAQGCRPCGLAASQN